MIKKNKKKKDAIFERQLLEADLKEIEERTELDNMFGRLRYAKVEDRKEKYNLSVLKAMDEIIASIKLLGLHPDVEKSVVHFMSIEMDGMEKSMDSLWEKAAKDGKQYGIDESYALDNVMIVNLLNRLLSFYKNIMKLKK